MITKLLGFCAIVLALIFVVLPGCKIEITVPAGGKVVTESGGYECFSGHACTIDVYDIFFDETFVAVPKRGYSFAGWKKKGKGFCGGKKKPCHLATKSFPGNDALMSILESDNIFYLEPIFARPGVDISLSKTADNTSPDGSEVINFTIEATNIGQDSAFEVKVIDLLPSSMRIPEGFRASSSTGQYDPKTGIWFIGELATGANEVLKLPAHIYVYPQPNCIVNSAEVDVSDSANYNNASEVTITRPGGERCVDLRPSIGINSNDPVCGGKQRLIYYFNVWNRGPEEARNVVLSLEESSLYKLRGLKFTSDNCTDFECRWESIPARIVRTVQAKSKEFNNEQPAVIASD